ncbi:MAG: chemotaxis protein CheW [Acidovorax sp.]|nr:chemotaxis protein CheW [Acidovorax sp.]
MNSQTLITSGDAHLEELLVFRLGEETYGVNILHVQEIRSYEAPTRMAHAPDYIKGVVNLRGAIVPIVDLRLKLGYTQAEFTEFTVVIVLNLGHTVVGAVVDAVADVTALPADAIKLAPQFEGDLNVTYVRGIATLDDHMLIVVDIEVLLSSAELGLVQATATVTI